MQAHDRSILTSRRHRVVIVGAGFGGDPAQSRIVLLDTDATILHPFPEPLQRRAVRQLERMGVEIHLGAMVTGIDERGVDTNAEDPRLRRIEAATKIWAAGVGRRRWAEWSRRRRAPVSIARAGFT
jgi:NADH dehydrogenase FAD-containing subunit